MHSPATNILKSIQALKYKLRDDHQELEFLRKNFCLPPTQELHEEDNAQCDKPDASYLQYQSQKSVNQTKGKMTEMRKKHHKQMEALKDDFRKEKQTMIDHYQSHIEQIKEKYEERITEQENYIILLEQQLETSRILSSRDQADDEKDTVIQNYEHIINNLTEKVTTLTAIIEKNERKQRMHEQITRRYMLPPKPDSNAIPLQNCPTKNKNPISANPSRLRFSKVQNSYESRSRRSLSNASSNIIYQYQSHTPVNDYKQFEHSQVCEEESKQNINSQNMMLSQQNSPSSKMGQEWSDEDIIDDQSKIKTIKHFWTNKQTTIKEIR